MDRFEFQLAMLQKVAEELEKKIANFTTILMKLKNAAITIWVALICHGKRILTSTQNMLQLSLTNFLCNFYS
ncbi:hypothetical protein [Microcoleus sp. Pol12A5]|uniref:hypothetical protein n=1 Tax=Microcoleus sp. Pol12A5 TaxID=3055392 RepID=UPI002FD1C03D